MARMTPVQAAKEIGIRPQIVYGFIRSNRLGTFNNPEGKTPLVELDDVLKLVGGVRHHREKDPTTGQLIKHDPGVSRGSMVSFHGELNYKGKKKRRAHRVVIIEEVVKSDTTTLIYAKGEEGRVGMIWEAENLASAIAKGKCWIESPENLLGVLMFHFAQSMDRPDLTASLGRWAQEHEITPTNMSYKDEEVATITESREPETTSDDAEEQLHGEE